jgi:hypothetical protein
MTHVRNRVEARELLSALQAAELPCHFFIVSGHAENRYRRIAEAVKPDDRVPVTDEASDVGRGGVDYEGGIRVEHAKIGIEVKLELRKRRLRRRQPSVIAI